MSTIMFSSYSQNNKNVVDITLKNHFDYCTKYGISFFLKNEIYSPIVDLNLISSLFNIYDTVIVIGTDIIITDFNKNILDFNDNSKLIVIQYESLEGGLNGDLIFFNKCENYQQKFNELIKMNKYFDTTQDILNNIKEQQFIKTLPIRTVQSTAPYGGNEKNQNIQNALWKQGDFSIHFNVCGICQTPVNKAKYMKKFLSTWSKKQEKNI